MKHIQQFILTLVIAFFHLNVGWSQNQVTVTTTDDDLTTYAVDGTPTNLPGDFFIYAVDPVSGNVVDKQSTDTGTATFNLADGTYNFYHSSSIVDIGNSWTGATNVPSGYSMTSSGVVPVNQTDNPFPKVEDVTINADTNLIFGFTQTSNLGAIKGNVKEDNGADVEGVTIQLYNQSGNLISEKTTLPANTSDPTAVGSYTFSNLPPGEYNIVQIQPAGYNSVSEVDGGDDGDHPDNGIENNIPATVDIGETDTGNDFVETVPTVDTPCPDGTTEVLFEWSTAEGSGNEWLMSDSGASVSKTYTLNYTDALGNAETIDVTLTMTDPDGINMDDEFDCPRPGRDCGLNEGSPLGTKTNGVYGAGFLTVFEATQNSDQNLTFDFSFSKPVYMRDFSVGDIDWSTLNAQTSSNNDIWTSFQDEVILSATSGGNPATLNVQEGSALTVTQTADGTSIVPTDWLFGPNGEGINGNVGPGEPSNTVRASSAEQIDSFRFIYSNGPADDGINNGEDDPGSSNSHAIRVNGFKFCIVDLAAVGGRVTEDTDNDDDGDVGIDGVTITLQKPDGTTATDSDGNPLTTTTSDGTTDVDGDGTVDPAGSYYFANVPPGEYNVVETQPTDYITVTDEDTSEDSDTNANSSTTDNSIPVTLVAGKKDLDNNFVEEKPARIKGQVLVDQDNDDTGDVGLAGVTMTLQNPDGTTATDSSGNPLTTTTSDGTTDVDGDGTIDPIGSYYFGDVPPGEYNIVETQPDGYITVTDGDTSDDSDTNTNTSTTDNSIPVTLTSGEFDTDNLFVEEVANTIKGKVTADTTADDTDNPTALFGQVVTLKKPDGTTAVDENGDPFTTTTGADGTYEFTNVPDGTYEVVMTPPADLTPVSDTDGSDDGDNGSDTKVDSSIDVSVSGGVTDSDNDFVLVLTSILPIELVYFDAVPTNIDAILTWATASEQGSSHYEVYHSLDGVNFSFVDRINSLADAEGNSSEELSYSYTHKGAAFIENQFAENVYYQIKQVDLDGQSMLTEIRLVNFTDAVVETKVFPNPALKGADVLIQADNIQSVLVYNIDGHLETKIEDLNGVKSTSISTTNLRNGVYIIVINNNMVQKLIIN